MSTMITRRNLLKFAGGSALGFLFTPLPWKLLDDSAIWTQNGPWLPRALRGPISFRYSTCTMCAAGCGIKARMVGTQPVSMAGVAGHPVSHGALCPAGIGGHHLSYLPDRLDEPVLLTVAGGVATPSRVRMEAAMDGIARAINGRHGDQLVVVLDEQPGRAASQMYRQFIQSIPNAGYAVHPNLGQGPLEILAGMFDAPCGPWGYDLEHSRTILSIGAPLFDGWGTPGRMANLALRRGSDSPVRILQVESRFSRTANMADERVPLTPGTELDFVLALSHCLLHGRGSDTSFASSVRNFSPEAVETTTGVAAGKIRTLARQLVQNRPSLVIPGGDAGGGPLAPDVIKAIWALNFILGSIGTPGGVVSRNDLPFEKPAGLQTLHDIPDRAVSVLIVDAATSGSAVPVSLLARKMAPGGIVVTLSPFLRGGVVHNGYVIPTPAPFESYDDNPAPFDAARASYSLSAPLHAAAENRSTPCDFIGKLAGAIGSTFTGPPHEDLLKQRVAAIHAMRDGSVFVPAEHRSIPVASIGSSDEMWQLMVTGGCWVDDKAAAGRFPTFVFPNSDWKNTAPHKATREYPLALLPYGWQGAAGRGQVSPLFTKLYQESGLRSGKGRVFVHPETGRSSHLEDGGNALLSSSAGSLITKVSFDTSVMPGVIEAPVGKDIRAEWSDSDPLTGDDILALCEVNTDGTWRITHASLAEARA